MRIDESAFNYEWNHKKKERPSIELNQKKKLDDDYYNFHNRN